MKKCARFVVPMMFVFSFVPSAFCAQQAEQKIKADPLILVDDDKVQCPTAKFTTIQSAVDAANPGDTIRVCAGTYAEQVTISKSLTIRGDNGAIVMPGAVTVNGSDIPSGTPVAAVIVVTDASPVAIDNLIVDGSNNGISECSPDFKGILFQNSSGYILHNAIRHIRLASSLSGCQSGEAIEVETASGLSSTVIIHDNSVWEYQKNGITANQAGTTATITTNTVTGIGPTTGAAQNGIQVAFGATGSITGNTIADNIWATCVSTSDCSTNATGILVFESDGIVVASNTTGSNQIGIFIGGNGSTVRSNTVFNSEVLVGVALAGNSNTAESNSITHSDQAAVFVQGNGNTIRNNEITDAAIGILKISGSTGTTISGNTFFATPVPVQDPAPKTPIKVQPAH
jgi:parallel beta-helix repeat protein